MFDAGAGWMVVELLLLLLLLLFAGNTFESIKVIGRGAFGEVRIILCFHISSSASSRLLSYTRCDW